MLVCFCLLFSTTILAQSIIDIVDPYEMRVSRSKEADTFFFTPDTIQQSLNPLQKIDTLRSYNVFLEERITPFGIAYMCNGNEITKKQYTEYKKFWNALDACTPCLLNTYNDKNEMMYSAFQYKNCFCGSYKEYYAQNKLKVEGQFKQNTSGNWDNLKSRNLCSIRDGVWTYYNEDGLQLKTEIYKNGKLIETRMSNSNPTTTNEQQQESNSNTEKNKKSIFQRFKKD